jgi:tryptophan synthase alpha chain
MLEAYLRTRRNRKDILLMTHIVLGYPSFDASFRIVEEMVSAGVDLMELQIPFSEPIADGPVILHANQKALAAGSTVSRCIDFAHKVGAAFGIPFLFMSYYNIPFQYGLEAFAEQMAEAGLKGAIVPDLPPEEGSEYLSALRRHGLAPVFIITPTTPFERMKALGALGDGFVYCIARKGITGADTDFSERLDAYLALCRKATRLPLAVGFGVKDKEDVDFLKGKVDIAVIGTQTIRLIEESGIEAVGGFIRGLR